MKSLKLLVLLPAFICMLTLLSCNEEEEEEIIPDYATEVTGAYKSAFTSEIIVVSRSAKNEIVLSNGMNTTFLPTNIIATISDKRLENAGTLELTLYTIMADDADISISIIDGEYVLNVIGVSSGFAGNRQ